MHFWELFLWWGLGGGFQGPIRSHSPQPITILSLKYTVPLGLMQY